MSINIGQRIRSKRITKRLTQQQLARMVDVSHVTIASIEKDNLEQVRIITFERIAQVLDTTVEDLFLIENC